MTSPSADSFVHRNLHIDGLSLHVVELRRDAPEASDASAILLLHGWPEDWSAFRRVMQLLPRQFRVLALDLPGIGQSLTPAAAADKRTLARHVRALVNDLGLRDLNLVGHDVGGQIVYAYLRAFPGELRSAAILNVAVPGVDPWSKLRQNPNISTLPTSMIASQRTPAPCRRRRGVHTSRPTRGRRRCTPASSGTALSGRTSGTISRSDTSP
jgi:pimeloyl-ACP methyl ester carboxylesterase